jgi:uncharacterized protein YoxC
MRKQSSPSSLLSPRLSFSFLIPALALLFLASSPLSAQSFQDEKVYQVQGRLLNKLEVDLQMAKKSLADLQMQNEELKKQSDGKLETLNQLQTQLQTVSLSLKKSEEAMVVDAIGIGVTAGVLGYLLGWVVHPK